MSSEVYVKREDCRACKSPALESVLDLGTQYLVNFVDAVDYSLPKAPLHLVRCAGCGLLQLEHTTNPDLLFRTFWYRTGINQTMREAMQDIVADGMKLHDSGVWLDIGANDGYLLSTLGDSFTKIACEPAKTFVDDLAKIANHSINDYFSPDFDFLYDGDGNGRCDIITSAAMFYDIDEPGQFVRDIAKVLSPTGVWINQLNDSPTMMAANAFDAICHEHLCYYDLASLEALYRANGLEVFKVSYNDVNGGSMRVFAKKSQSPWKPFPTTVLDVVSLEQAKQFAGRVRKWRTRMIEFLGSCREPVWLYGASTKGAVALQYLNANYCFAGIADRNEHKHGKYMAGAWIRIHDEEEMRRQKPETIMVLPWAFRDEFVKRERETLDNGACMVFPLPNIEVVL